MHKPTKQFHQLISAASQKVHPAAAYRHYKGGEYTVLHLAILEASQDPAVVYQAKDGLVWIRTLDDFTATVEPNGQKVPRFQEISPCKNL